MISRSSTWLTAVAILASCGTAQAQLPADGHTLPATELSFAVVNGEC